MFDKLILSLSIVLILMLSGCFIEGRVVDENGKGVAGITVILGGDQSRTTTTNSEGIYYFGDLAKRDMIPAGNYSVTPSKSGHSFTPAGTVIHADGVYALDDPDNYNQVPIILGTNLEEIKTFLFPFYSLMPAESYQTLTMQESELWKMNGVDSLAQMISPHKTQPGVYAYQFLYGKPHEYYPHLEPFTAWPTDLDGINYAVMLGAMHGLDVPFFFGDYSFLFGSLLFREDNRGGYEALTDAMMAYVAQFARTGIPNVDGLPEWTEWSNMEGEAKRILFDANADEAVIEMSTE